MRDFALQNPGDLVALLLGSVYGINKIKNISPEKKAEVENIVKRIGATPVGLSMDVDYGGSHKPPSFDGGAPGHDVTKGSEGGVFPNDIYSDKGLRYYGTGDANDTEAINIINSMKGNPDMDVTIYRAVPNESNITDINNGDWVTTVKSYADDHAATGYGNTGNESGKVLSKTVKAKDIFTNGDSIMEWGYSPIKDEIKPKPFVDAAGTYSKAEQVVLNMPQKSMGVKEIVPFLQNRGILNAEIKDLNIDKFVDDFKGDTVTKEGLLDHIGNNQTQLLSTSLLSPTNTGSTQSAANTIFITDPQQAYEYLGRGFHNNEETPDGFITVNKNKQEIDDNAEVYLNNIVGSIAIGDNNAVPGKLHYPYNFNPEDKYFDAMKPENGLRQDISTGLLMRSLHELNPDKYPMTSGIQILNNHYTQHSNNVTFTEKNVARNDTLAKVSTLQDQNKQGIDEWDQTLAKQWSALKYGRQPFDQSPDPGLIPGDVMQDIDTVAKLEAEDQYLNNPQFEQTIPITTQTGDEVNYTVIGRESDGYFVYNPNGDLVADSVDLPMAQNLLNRDAQTMDYIRNENVGMFDDKISGESIYHGYLSAADKKYADTYSEELISLVPNTNKKSAYYEGSRIGGEGYQYDQGHYGGRVPNTLISYRKVIVPNTAVKKTDGSIAETGAYKIVEMQSDWIQDGRQFGFTAEEHASIGDDLRVLDKNLNKALGAINVFTDSMADIYESLENGQETIRDNAQDMAQAALQDIPNWLFKQSAKASIKQMAHKGIVNQYKTSTSSGDMGLSTATMNSPEYKRALDQFGESAKSIDKQIDADWENSALNPESVNFDMTDFYETDDKTKLHVYIADYIDDLEQKIDAHDNHTPSPRNPLTEKDIYLSTGLQDAIAKAHAQGLKYVTWSSGKQILDRWNKSRDLDFKGNTKYKELYSNMYDSKMPKAAKKFLNKYKGIALQEMEVDGEINYVIEITDELIKNLQEDFNLPKDSKMLPMPKYGKASDIPTGLLKTDIIEQQGLLA